MSLQETFFCPVAAANVAATGQGWGARGTPGTLWVWVPGPAHSLLFRQPLRKKLRGASRARTPQLHALNAKR